MATPTRLPTITTACIIAGLDRIAHGQHEAKQLLASAALTHLLGVQRTNVLLCAPTGAGKTLLATSLGEVLSTLLRRELPVVVVDASALVPAGIRGTSLASLLIPEARRIKRSGAQEALQGILVLDELDKLAGGEHDSGLRPEAEKGLLTLLNGDRLWLGHEDASTVTFHARQWMVVATGAFSSVRARVHARSAAPEASAATAPVTLDDLREHGGLLAETWGRFHAMAELRAPTLHDLTRVAREHPGLRAVAVLAQQQGIVLEIGASFIERAAGAAMQNRDAGYRAVAGALHHACARLCDMVASASPRARKARVALTARDYEQMAAGTWRPPLPATRTTRRPAPRGGRAA